MFSPHVGTAGQSAGYVLRSAMSVEFYEREADAFISQTLGVDMTELYDRFLPQLPKKGLILDAGCGSGRDAKNFLDKGYRVVAFDASSKMAQHASSLTDMDVACMTFAEVNWTEQFDGIWCSASLLHVPADEFRASRTSCSRR